jgi:arylsulfatase A-like enzyme
MGPRGDAIAELDWSAGQVLKTLDDLGLADNTLVIFSSDNGPVVDDGYMDDAVEKLGSHKPAGPLRGGKSTAFEGGTREPFIVRWPKHVPAGKTSKALICQIDLLASLAVFTDQKLPNHAAPDSVNVLPALLGESPNGREELVEQGRNIGLRQKNWKYIEPARQNAAGPNQRQLYDLGKDLSEQHNLAKQQPEKVKELSSALDRIRKSGRMP